jgi:hypothetical protein
MKKLFLAVSMAMILSGAALANCKDCEHKKDGETCDCSKEEGHHKKTHGKKHVKAAKVADKIEMPAVETKSVAH